MEKVQRRKYRKRKLFFRRTLVCFGAAAILFGLANGTMAIVKGISGNFEELDSPLLSSASPALSSRQRENQEDSPSAVAAQAPLSSSVPEQETTSEAFGDAVFIGDSRTEGLQNYDGLKGATYYAVKGLMVSTVYTKKAVEVSGQRETVMQAVRASKFGRVYIMLGVNELGWSSSEVFIKDYGKIIDDIHRFLPEAKIYIQSILPVSAKKSREDPIYNNPKINSYNEMLKGLAKDKGAAYLDTAQAVRNSTGALPEGASSDGIHLNSEYCKKWCEYLIAQ